MIWMMKIMGKLYNMHIVAVGYKMGKSPGNKSVKRKDEKKWKKKEI